MAVAVWSPRTWTTSWNYQGPAAITSPQCVGPALFLLNFSWRRLNKAKSVWFFVQCRVHGVQPPHPLRQGLCYLCASSRLTPTSSHPCAKASQHAAVEEEGTVSSPGSCAQLCLPRKGHAQGEALCKWTGEGAGTLGVTEGYINPEMLSLEDLSVETEERRKGRHWKASQGRYFKAFEEGRENHGPLPGR